MRIFYRYKKKDRKFENTKKLNYFRDPKHIFLGQLNPNFWTGNFWIIKGKINLYRIVRKQVLFEFLEDIIHIYNVDVEKHNIIKILSLLKIDIHEYSFFSVYK